MPAEPMPKTWCKMKRCLAWWAMGMSGVGGMVDFLGAVMDEGGRRWVLRIVELVWSRIMRVEGLW